MASGQETSIMTIERIQHCIFLIRGQKVMLDHDLALLYGVETKVLNQAVKRNKTRFFKDFMFKLDKLEKEKVVTNCDHLQILRFSPSLPYAFTEQGCPASSIVNGRLRSISRSCGRLYSYAGSWRTMNCFERRSNRWKRNMMNSSSRYLPSCN